MAKRWKFTGQFKAKVALEALGGDRTTQEITAKHQVHPNQVSTWKRQAVEGMADVFSRGGKPEGPSEAEIKELHAKIGRLAVENDILRDDQTGPPAAQHQPAVQAGAAEPVGILLHSGRDRRGHAKDDERDRPGVHQVSVLWQPPDRSLSASGRGRHRPSSCQVIDGEDGFGSNLQTPPNQPAASPASGLPVLAEKDVDRPSQSGLVHRYHVRAGQERRTTHIGQTWKSRKQHEA